MFPPSLSEEPLTALSGGRFLPPAPGETDLRALLPKEAVDGEPDADTAERAPYFQTHTRLSPLPVAKVPLVGDADTPMTEFLNPVTVAT